MLQFQDIAHKFQDAGTQDVPARSLSFLLTFLLASVCYLGHENFYGELIFLIKRINLSATQRQAEGVAHHSLSPLATTACPSLPPWNSEIEGSCNSGIDDQFLGPPLNVTSI